MATELTNATATSPPALQRRSDDYMVWLIVELGRLAAYLGKSDALDTDGYRASEMAKDLADTDPKIMETALRELRKDTEFFPTTKEILIAYRVARRAKHERDDAEEKRAAQAERTRMAQRAKEHPDEFVRVDDLVREALKKSKEMPK